ncbi:hypothetical protein [Mycobacteroides abscessus]|uniref:hypothetical protein n=1 Tax=Mycobacteroides abscessus TaxID=36809 RepID=UPI00092644BD|nr:hypothetical protein [Mycobacteroides abscessus]SIE16434.1 Helix-turn-helix protein [Mycobacteroides abscessus subsp. abscessus]
MPIRGRELRVDDLIDRDNPEYILWDQDWVSIPFGDVNIPYAAASLRVSQREVRRVIAHAKAEQRTAFYRGISGRKTADIPSGRDDVDEALKVTVKGMLQAAFGTGPRGAAVNVKAAAAGMQVTAGTVHRWAAGAQRPSAAHLARVKVLARQAATTKKGRKVATDLFRNSARGRDALARDTRFTITGWQGPRGYVRYRTVDSYGARPNQLEMMLRAYENDGDRGLYLWLCDHYGNRDDDREEYVEDWQFLTIDYFGIGAT